MKFDIQKTNMVKCIAIILMLWHHLFGCATMVCEQYGTESAFFEWNSIYRLGLLWKICVGIYVFLTAYGMTRSYNAGGEEKQKRELEKFCFHRYFKLALNFAFVFGISVLTSFLRESSIQSIYFSEGRKKGVLYMIFDMLGVANYFGTPSMNETWWYMSVAVFMVFAIPVFIKLYKKIGAVMVPLAFFLFYFGVTKNSFIQYAMCIIMGIYCAEENVLEKLFDIQICSIRFLNKLGKLIFWAVTFSFLVYMRSIFSGYIYWIDAVVPISCCGFCMELYDVLPLSERIMGFIGKHSMNIFLIHTLIFEYYFTEFIYGFQNWFLILLALLLTSLLGSMMIEYLKKLFRYDKLIGWFCR